MRNFFQKRITGIVLIVAFLAIFGVGFYIGKTSVVCKHCIPEQLDFSLFWEAWDLLSEQYVEKDKIKEKEMIYGAISGLTDSLGDPYTAFFSPEEGKKFLEEVNGSFEGVGMEISVKKGQLQVVAPLEGTPAQRAGLRAGDKILKIGDKVTTDMTSEEAVSLIRGPKNTEVTLTILRNDWETSKEITLKRAVIEIPSMSWKIVDNDIAYIKLHQFNGQADYEFSKAVMEIVQGPAKKIILDLRNNPGGYLEVAQSIASWFLENDQVIVIEDFGEKKPETVFKSTGGARLMNYLLVVLINEGSASASEILAAALRDNRGVKLIGKTSFGKGSVQEFQNLSDGSNLKITVARWLTPDRNQINEKGLEPDIKVEMTDEDFNNGKDPQLEKALEIIKEIQ